MADDEKVQVNAGEMPAELVEKLDAMCAQDENNRSQFIRKLIRQEWERRTKMPIPLKLTKKGKAQVSTAVPA